jgi:hypothetical protein
MVEKTRPPVVSGGCQCGAVRYALYAPTAPARNSLCHCRMCQKATGGPFAALASVHRDDFAWTRGAPATFQSSTVAARDFCAACGTPLTFRYLDSEWIEVTIGSLDRPGDAPPTKHYGWESKVSWLDQIFDLPVKTTEETLAPQRKASLQSFQHPDHDTPDDWQP